MNHASAIGDSLFDICNDLRRIAGTEVIFIKAPPLIAAYVLTIREWPICVPPIHTLLAVLTPWWIAAMPTGIDELQWVVVNVRVSIETLRIRRIGYNSIGRDPAAKLGIIPPIAHRQQLRVTVHTFPAISAQP